MGLVNTTFEPSKSTIDVGKYTQFDGVCGNLYASFELIEYINISSVIWFG